MDKKELFIEILSPIFRLIISSYILYIFFFEKELRRHSPINIDTILMIVSAIWLINVISKSIKEIKWHLQKKN